MDVPHYLWDYIVQGYIFNHFEQLLANTPLSKVGHHKHFFQKDGLRSIVKTKVGPSNYLLANIGVADPHRLSPIYDCGING